MNYTWEYIKTIKAEDSFYADDISNICIRCNDDLDNEFYLKIATILGETHVIKFGPIIDDVIADEFKLEVLDFPYNEKRIIKLVDNILNNPKFDITQVEEIDDEAFEEGLDVVKDCL